MGSNKLNENGLTHNEQIFCDEWLKDRNGTRSYKVAYTHIKKDKVAGSLAVRLLAKERVDKYLQKKLKEISNSAVITAERILKEEARIAYSDARKLFSGKWTSIPPGDLDDDTARAIAGVEVKENKTYGADGEVSSTEVTFKYKFWDKGQALNRLEKIKGMFAKDNEQKVPFKPDLSKMSDEQLEFMEEIGALRMEDDGSSSK